MMGLVVAISFLFNIFYKMQDVSVSKTISYSIGVYFVHMFCISFRPLMPQEAFTNIPQVSLCVIRLLILPGSFRVTPGNEWKMCLVLVLVGFTDLNGLNKMCYPQWRLLLCGKSRLPCFIMLTHSLYILNSPESIVNSS